MDPPWKEQNLAFSTASLTVLIFASLFKEGLLRQNPEYKLTVPATVSVQRGLCVHIPCSFTSGRTNSGKAYGYWVQKKDKHQKYFVTSYTYHTILGIIVATNDDRVALHESVVNRFRLTGRLTDGNCSFSILEAKSEDAGEYYFRFETPSFMFTYKTTETKGRMPLKVLVTELTDKPQIWNNSPVLSGKETVFTCSVPGPCFKMNTKITWTTILMDYKIFLWIQQHSNGSWTYGSDFIFTPSAADQGKWLTCWVWYPSAKKEVQNTIFLDLADQLSGVRKVNRTRHKKPDWAQDDMTVVNGSRHGRAVSIAELFVYSVDVFQILLFLFKFVACFLFIIWIFWLLGWR